MSLFEAEPDSIRLSVPLISDSFNFLPKGNGVIWCRDVAVWSKEKCRWCLILFHHVQTSDNPGAVTAGHGRSRPVTAKGSGLWRLYEAVAVGVSEFFELLERTRL